jgi:glycosyltransferase involved in cell wall biosynthesis
MKYVHHGVNMGQADTQETGSEKFSQIIIVGRLAEMKGHRFLIEALPLITAKFPELKLLILGEGNARDELNTLAQKLKVAANIEFLGFQKPGNYIKDSQLMIVPSIFEPFGLVFIEAFALKIPVIAFDVGAGNEIIENNVTGFLVAPFNVNLLAEKIIFLLQNPEERKRIAENAYQKYLSSFTTDKMIAETVAWYKSL